MHDLFFERNSFVLSVVLFWETALKPQEFPLKIKEERGSSRNGNRARNLISGKKCRSESDFPHPN